MSIDLKKGPIALIGQHGQVSTYLQSALSDASLDYVVVGREQLDLTDTNNIQPVLTKLTPSLVVNPAAYTAVDLAEQEIEQAELINRDAVAQIAAYCEHSKTPLIHYSTDYVFSGDADQAYKETDSVSPNGVYGLSKLQGEQAILSSGALALILRTSWVYSQHGKNFYKTMLALSESRDELSIVADQMGAPTYAGSIAKTTVELIEILIEQGGLTEAQSGVYHFTCGGQTSWFEFAQAIFQSNGKSHMTLNPVTTEEYPTPAKRPAFSVLDNSKLNNVFAVSLPSWRDALALCVAEAAS